MARSRIEMRHRGDSLPKRGRRVLSAALVVLALILVVPVGGSAAPGLPGCSIQGPAHRECSFVSGAAKIAVASARRTPDFGFWVIVRPLDSPGFFCSLPNGAGQCASGKGASITLIIHHGNGVLTASDTRPTLPALGTGCTVSKGTGPGQRECTYTSVTGKIRVAGIQVPPLDDSWAMLHVIRPDGSTACLVITTSAITFTASCNTVPGSTVRAILNPNGTVIVNPDKPLYPAAVLVVRDVP